MSIEEGQPELPRGAYAPSPGRKARMAAQPFVAGGAVLRLSAGAQCLAVLALLVSAVLLSFGVVLPSFGVQVFGAGHFLIEAGAAGGAERLLSIADVSSLIAADAEPTVASVLGLHLVVVMFVATCIGTPIAQAAGLCVLWFARLTLRQQRKALRLVEAVASWEFTAVYLIAVLLTLTQLAGVSSMMVEPHCGSLDAPLQALADAGFIPSQHATCFQLRGTMEAGFFVILAGSSILALATQLLLRAARSHIADRARRARPPPRQYCCRYRCLEPWDAVARALWWAATTEVSRSSLAGEGHGAE